MAFIRYNVFLPITSVTSRTASSIAKLWIERNGVKLSIDSLGVPFNIGFPLDQRIPKIQQLIADVHIHNLKTQAEALAEGLLSCQFYN